MIERHVLLQNGQMVTREPIGSMGNYSRRIKMMIRFIQMELGIDVAGTSEVSSSMGIGVPAPMPMRIL